MAVQLIYTGSGQPQPDVVACTSARSYLRDGGALLAALDCMGPRAATLTCLSRTKALLVQQEGAEGVNVLLK
jgi:hypothetical protein